MTDHIDNLITHATKALGPNLEPQDINPLRDLAYPSNAELLDMLEKRNGFYAFDDSLHVFPLGGSHTQELRKWNESEGWKSEYDIDLSDVVFFAEDLFGEQFALRENEATIFRFDPELGELEKHSDNLRAWARTINEDADFETGQSVAQTWQTKTGALAIGKRLMPAVPFCCEESSYDIESLRLVDAYEMMHFRAQLASQIRTLPDGAPINIEIPE